MKSFGWLLAAFVSFAFVTSQVHSDVPNIVWINAEDMSPHLGCYGHPDAMTPYIDELASDGIVYRNAFSTAPICSPSRSCLATGLYATSLGTQHLRCEIEIPERVVPLATRLKQHGYYCTTSGKTDYNFDPSGIWDQRTNDSAPWRRRKNSDQPFFAFITVGETHEGPTNHLDRYEAATKNLPPEQRHDPAKVTLPPFYPDSPEIRRIFAGMHDLASVFDRKVGELIQTLKEDGDYDNTILFVFGDHGNGLPRYKRWLNDSGLRVPLVVYLPPKYRSDAIPGKEMKPSQNGQLETERLVSFVDFPATALSLAGIPIPDLLQGQAFLGQERASPRKFVFGARSRADDMYEVSRSVSDGRYIYVRHFMPHLPYIQPSVIFDDSKSSFKELRRLYRAGELDEHAGKLWSEHKPMEELYDLQADPHELNNLADAPETESIKKQLRDELHSWILSHRDSGFMPESEYQIRSRQQGQTPFDIVEAPEHFDLASALDMASLVGNENDLETWKAGLKHPESAVRYWAAVGLLAAHQIHSRDLSSAKPELLAALGDEAPCVAIAAAQTLLAMPELSLAESRRTQLALSRLMLDERPWVALEACRATTLLGHLAKPLVPVMKQVVEANLAESGERRRYKDFNYASFTGWTLETSLRICGEEDYVDALYADVPFEDDFAAASRGEAFPIRVPKQGRTLLDAHDKPFILRGRTAWYVLSLPPEDAVQLLDDTVSKGFNAIEIKAITHDKNGNNPPFAGNGELPFLKRLDGTPWDGTFQGIAPDFASVNEKYWSFVDNFLGECRERGIAVLFFPAYVGYDGGEQGWMQQMVANGSEKTQAYGEWIAQRYRDFDNLIWMIGGDYAKFKPQESQVEQALIDGMRSVPNQLSTVWSAEWESNLNACDHPTLGKFTNFNGVYSWENSITRCSREAYAHQPTRPAFLLEEPYDEEGPDGSNYNPNATQPVRRFIYWGWLNTIGGYVAGNGYVWRCKPGWQKHLDSPGAQDLAHLNAFIQSIDAERLIPSGLGGMHKLVTSGQGSPDQLDYIASASTPDGSLVVAYASPNHASEFQLDLSHLRCPGKARWWDPTSGAYIEIGNVPASPNVTFKPPVRNSRGQTDWILRIDASQN